MRKLTMIVMAAGLVLLMVAPVSAGPAPTGTGVQIAVPGFVPVDGTLDLVVFTGSPAGYVEAPAECFGIEGVYQVRKLVIQDSTAGQHGATSGAGAGLLEVVTSEPLQAGSRIDDMAYNGVCEIDGLVHRLYVGTVR